MATTIIKSADSDNQALVDSTGHLLVSGNVGGNASVGSTGATAPTSATEVAGLDPTGNLKAITVDANGFLNVNGISTETGLNSFQTSQNTVGTSAVHLAAIPLANRSSISLAVSADPNIAVYIGNSSAVTISNGYPLYDGSSLQLDLTPDGNVWAISTVAGQTVAVLEIA